MSNSTTVRDSSFTRKPGKTERDRKNGAFQRNAENKAARAAWQADSNKKAVFPLYTCNGKKSQSIRKAK
jgi:hypothetical protein